MVCFAQEKCGFCTFRFEKLYISFSRLYFGTIHDYLRMENLLVDALVEIVRHSTDKHALCEVGNLACRDKTVHLSGD